MSNDTEVSALDDELLETILGEPVLGYLAGCRDNEADPNAHLAITQFAGDLLDAFRVVGEVRHSFESPEDHRTHAMVGRWHIRLSGAYRSTFTLVPLLVLNNLQGY